MTLIDVFRRCAVLALAFAVAGCATADPNAEMSASDPYQSFNEEMLKFNLALDRNIVRPAAQGYDFITPATIKHVLGNGFSHLDLPADFINYLLQGQPEMALETLGRFTINTVLGAGGFLDPATEFGLPKKDTDFGITLGRRGVGEGAYLVLPLIGPTTVRDAFGGVVDVALTPTTYIGVVEPGLSPEFGIALRVTETIHDRNANADLIDRLLYESADPYISLRSVYLQRRRSEVSGDAGAADALPNIFEN
ncbi:MAG: VacJ family lipoprotein [Candidatus Zixiibacteriota bacterium]|nr:MAG: VacJ family lipoprotein [candidate division Zixibacteria bacterium]